MYGLSLPFSWLYKGGDRFGPEAAVPGRRAAFFAALASFGAGSIELRGVKNDSAPEKLFRAARELWDSGFQITVHGAVTSAETAVREVFGPVSLIANALPNLRQSRVNVTIHAVNGDGTPEGRLAANVEMMERLARHILERRLPVSISLENSRKMPDGTDGDSVALVTAAVTAVREKLTAEGYEIPLGVAGRNPVIGTCFDMGHYAWVRAQIAPGEEYAPPIPEFLRLVIHTHIHALNPEGRTHFPLSAPNELPLRENLKALGKRCGAVWNLELGFTRFPEIPPIDAMRESLAALDRAMSVTMRLAASIREQFTADLLRAGSVLRTPDVHGTRFAMVQSTFYVFNTNGTRWIMDPALRLAGEITNAPDYLRASLRGTEYALITHGHVDHFEEGTVRRLAGMGIRWVIPDFLTETALAMGLTADEIITARPGEELSLGALRVTPFVSRHFRPTTGKGVPEYGYLVRAANAPTILFPGDIRNYDPAGFPEFDAPIDVLFAHVWLGDYVSLCDTFPYTDDFVRLMSSFGARRVLFTHLYESGRKSNCMWRRDHAEMLAARIREIAPATRTDIPRGGEIFQL